ncbi:MAG: hypothetical protein MUE81_21235 [Thermoflexibacter sp.]|jgi:hypothetical protein|nr:hypothetical protein [Thermoflexibacter sp.]
MKMTKKIYSIILLLAVCFACNKNEESADLSLSLQGNYRISTLQINNQTIIPTPSGRPPTTGIVNVTRTAQDAVNITVTLSDANGTQNFPFGAFSLKNETGGVIGIYNPSNVSVGTGSNSEINFSVSLGPSSFSLKATKQ